MIRKIACVSATAAAVFAFAENVTLNDLAPYGNDAKMEDAPGYWATTGRVDTVVSQCSSVVEDFDARLETVSKGVGIDDFDSRLQTVAEGPLTRVDISGWGDVLIIR